MSSSIELEYIYKISSSLEGFYAKSTFHFNARCPVCGDSKKSKTKKRLHINQSSQEDCFVICCHNCHEPDGRFSVFLKNQFPDLHKEFVIDKLKASGKFREFRKFKPHVVSKSKKLMPTKVIEQTRHLRHTMKISQLDSDHPAYKYAVSRKFTDDMFKNFLYTHDFRSVAMQVNEESANSIYEGDSRIVIPFLDRKGYLFGMSGRSIQENSSLKYINILEDGYEKEYMFRPTHDETPVIVVEGPIDSAFLNNSKASCDATLWTVEGDIYAFDNQPRHREVIGYMETAINMGLKVVVWPNFIKGKDINDMILSGMSSIDIQQIIYKHSFRGAEAKIKFSTWKKRIFNMRKNR